MKNINLILVLTSLLVLVYLYKLQEKSKNLIKDTSEEFFNVSKDKYSEPPFLKEQDTDLFTGKESVPETAPSIPHNRDIPHSVVPNFIKWPSLKVVVDSSLGSTLKDIESHMKEVNHNYKNLSNKINWSHETTHALNSYIRNSVNINNPGTIVNGFYCLEDRACIIKEPKVMIHRIASMVPIKLRGSSYNLYLENQAREWNTRPLYLFDEWIAYINGSKTGLELGSTGTYHSMLQMHNFNIYCIYAIMAIKKDHPEYDDSDLKSFTQWNIERTFKMLEPLNSFHAIYLNPIPLEVSLNDDELLFEHIKGQSHPYPIYKYGDDSNPFFESLSYIELVRDCSEGEELREFSRSYFGSEWCKNIFGF